MFGCHSPATVTYEAGLAGKRLAYLHVILYHVQLSIASLVTPPSISLH
jgi:hypothetical protein